MRSVPFAKTLKKSGLAVAAASAPIAIAMPLAFGAPTAAPPSDGQGYVDSAARCAKPDTAVLFGSTKTSQVAICMTAAGAYEYRGVRVSDGAKLVTAAKQTSQNSFAVNNDGVNYTITPTALSVTSGGNTFRTETWTDFHAIQSPASSSTSTSGTTSSKSTSAPTSATASATPGLTASPAPKSSAAASPSSAAPLPPPMAAEVGGGSSSG